MTGKIEITHYESRGEDLHDFTVYVKVGEFPDAFGTLMVLDVNEQGQAELGVTLDTDKRRRSEITDAGGNPIDLADEVEDAILDECERFLRYFDKAAVLREVEAQKEAALGAMASDDDLTAAETSWDGDGVLQQLRETIMRATAGHMKRGDALGRIEELFEDLDSHLVVGADLPVAWQNRPLVAAVDPEPEAEDTGERLVTYRRQVCIRQHQVWEVTVPAGMEISVDIADSLAFDDFVVAHGELVSHDDEDLPDDLAALEVEIAEVVPVRHLSV